MKVSAVRKTPAYYAGGIKGNLLGTTMLTAAALMATAAPAFADNAWVLQQAAGSFDTDASVDAVTNIKQNSSRAIGVGNLDIKSYQTVNIQQNSSGDLFVARDNRSDPTKILGALNANGKVMVIDRNGVFFGQGSAVNVGSIIATTGDASDDDIMDGDGKLEITNFGEGKIDLKGTVSVADAGVAAFVSPFVSNSGVISAKVGKVAFAAGEKVTLDLYGDSLIEIAVDDETADALLENSGAIDAEGGEVLITARAAKNAVDNVINMDGVVNVSSVTQKGGKIILSGGSKGKVSVSGKLNASGKGGGKIKVTGENISLAESSELKADSNGPGDGGEVIAFAGNLAIVNGRISARGGDEEGDGGFIETSGAELSISDTAFIDASARSGAAGLWLLDPLSIAITTAAFPGYTIVNANTLSTSLSGGTNVTIETGVNSAFTGGGGNNNEGDIRVRSNITHSGAANSVLTLIADDDILVENNADIKATGAGKLGLTFKADDDIIVNAGSDISTKGGDVLFDASGDLIDINQAIVTAGGHITLLSDEDIMIDAALDTGGGDLTATADDDIYTAESAPVMTGGGDVSFTAGDDITIDNDIATAGGKASFHAASSFIVDNALAGNIDQIITSGGDVSIIANVVDLAESELGAGETIINAGAGTVSVERDSSGDISLGDNNGGLRLSQPEIAAITAANLTIGGANTSEINVEDVNTTTATISGLVKLIAGKNTGNDDDVNFFGLNVFNALEVHANDDVVFDDDASVETLTGDASFTGDDNSATVGDFLMGEDSRLVTNGHKVNISVLNLTMEDDSEINSEGGDIHILTRDDFAGDGEVNILGGTINADGGDIVIDNRDEFFSKFANSVKTHSGGTIDINQWEGGKIQNAIDAVENTGSGLNTIHVGPGTFAENVRIYENNFVLEGANHGIDPNAGVRVPETIIRDPSGPFASAYGFKVTSNNVTIDGFKIDVDGNGVWLEGGAGGIAGFDIKNNIILTKNVLDPQDAGIFGHNASDALVRNNLLNVIGNDGVHFNGGADVNIQDNVISSTDYNGVYLLGVNGSVIAGNAINNTGLLLSGGDGISVNNGTGANTISGNLIGALGGAGNINGDGISVINTDGTQIISNTIRNTTGNGIYVNPSDFVNIDHNYIFGVGLDGIHVEGGYDVNINDNDILFAGLDGIDVNGNGLVFVTENDVFGVNYDGIHVENFGHADINENIVKQTGDDGIEAVTGRTVWIEGNDVSYAGYWTNNADFYGADGIHVRNVNGPLLSDEIYDVVSEEDYYEEEYEGDYEEEYEDDYEHAGNGRGFGPFGGEGDYNIVIINNDVGALDAVDPETEEVVLGSSGAKDDGIEVVGEDSYAYYDYLTDTTYNGAGRTLIAWNNVSNVGYGTTGGYYGAPDGYGADGIHVRGVRYAHGGSAPALALLADEAEDLSWGPDGYGYLLEILENTVTNTGSDGIQAIASGKTLVSGNEVDNTGLGLDGIDETYGYNDGDGIHVAYVHAQGDGYYSYDQNSVEVLNNDVTRTRDDGIEVDESGVTLIAGNHIEDAGFNTNSGYYEGPVGDYFGADGIHAWLIKGGGLSTAHYGGFYGFSLHILDNEVSRTGDDGIEAVYSSSTLIAGNEVDHAGAGSGYYYGGGDYYGADGIHVRTVHGDFGITETGIVEEEEVYPYAVVVHDNIVDTSADDGIEVIYSGRTLISENEVYRSGYADDNEGLYPPAPDGWGADGIHVRDVYAQNYYGYEDYVYDYSESYEGDGYDVEVIGNTVDMSADDGVEVTYGFSGVPKIYKGLVLLDSLEVGGEGTSVGVFNNIISNSGDDGIDVTNANYVWIDGNDVSVSGGDGVTVNRDGSDEGYYGYYDSEESFMSWGYYGYIPNNVVITNNVSVDQSGDDGIEVQGYGQIEVGSNVVTNSGDDGVIVHELLFGSFFEDAPSEYSVFFAEPLYAEAYVNIHDNNVDVSGGDGIQVDAHNFFTKAPAGSNVHVTGNTVTNSGENGLYISGPNHGYVYVADNAFLDNPTGARFESGLIDLTGPGNEFLNGDVGMLFSPYSFGEGFAFLDLVDDDGDPDDTLGGTFPPGNFGGTIGEQFFSGQSTYFVQLANGAFFEPGQPTILNGLNSTYDTPEGLVRPADTGGIVSQGVFDFLESRFFHFVDDETLGLFWFGFVPLSGAEISQEDIFRKFGSFSGPAGGLNITLLGLPEIPGGQGGGAGGLTPEALNAIQTFAGGEEGGGGLTPEELNAIDTAAGGEDGGGQANCWSDAVNAAYQGQVVNYSYGASAEETLAGAAACSGPQL